MINLLGLDSSADRAKQILSLRPVRQSSDYVQAGLEQLIIILVETSVYLYEVLVTSYRS